MVAVEHDPASWEFTVTQHLEETVPWLIPYVKGVVFKEIDEARGAGFGFAILVNGAKSAGAIIIIREFELLPIDVFEGEIIRPLTERRISEELGMPAVAKGLTAEPTFSRPTSIADQMKPPMDAAQPNSNMMVYSSYREVEGPKMIAGPGWAFAKYSSYIKEGLDENRAKHVVADEYFERKKQ